jgi:hypothetical protein
MIVIGLLAFIAYLLWKILATLTFMSLTPTNDDLWDIFSEYLSQEEPEEDY